VAECSVLTDGGRSGRPGASPSVERRHIATAGVGCASRCGRRGPTAIQPLTTNRWQRTQLRLRGNDCRPPLVQPLRQLAAHHGQPVLQHCGTALIEPDLVHRPWHPGSPGTASPPTAPAAAPHPTSPRTPAPRAMFDGPASTQRTYAPSFNGSGSALSYSRQAAACPTPSKTAPARSSSQSPVPVSILATSSLTHRCRHLSHRAASYPPAGTSPNATETLTHAPCHPPPTRPLHRYHQSGPPGRPHRPRDAGPPPPPSEPEAAHTSHDPAPPAR